MKGKGVVYPDGFLRALFSSLLQQVRILKQERKVLFQVVKLREMCRSQFNSQLFIPGQMCIRDRSYPYSQPQLFPFLQIPQ